LGRFTPTINKRRYIKVAVRMHKQLLCDCGSTFAEHVGENIIDFDVGNGTVR
jgi:hypothetical protein